MLVINAAATCFGSPAETAIQPAQVRQPKIKARKSVVPKAAHLAHPNPLAIRIPHTMLKLPKTPPLTSAVFAFSGLDANPTTPATIKKTP